jgi:hypothetical protein
LVREQVLDAAEARSFELLQGEVLSPLVSSCMLPFVRQLDDMDDLVDLFYLAQLRAQGEDSTQSRDITHAVPLAEVALPSPNPACLLRLFALTRFFSTSPMLILFSLFKAIELHSRSRLSLTGPFKVPNLMRALGYYPSEAEARQMMDEVRLSAFTTQGITKQFCT